GVVAVVTGLPGVAVPVPAVRRGLAGAARRARLSRRARPEVTVAHLSLLQFAVAAAGGEGGIDLRAGAVWGDRARDADRIAQAAVRDEVEAVGDHRAGAGGGTAACQRVGPAEPAGVEPGGGGERERAPRGRVDRAAEAVCASVHVDRAEEEIAVGLELEAAALALRSVARRVNRHLLRDVLLGGERRAAPGAVRGDAGHLQEGGDLGPGAGGDPGVARVADVPPAGVARAVEGAAAVPPGGRIARA